MPTEAATRLQEGIYIGTRPPSAYRLVLLNVRDATSSHEARDAIARVWDMLQRLCQGIVDELQPPSEVTIDTRVEPGELTCLLAFGSELFTRYPNLPRPDGVEKLGELPFNSLRWAPVGRQKGEADLAVQLIAKTELAVDRAVVELWMLASSGVVPLQFVAVHAGFNRDDRRSWLGFHDGISNIERSQRRGVIETTGENAAWLNGGTSMAFLRLELDLAKWRRLSRAQQEILVGRDKLSGCPLERVVPPLEPISMAGCPAGRNHPESPNYRNPRLPAAGQPQLRQSHMHRANLNRQSPPDQEQNNRIFRQGYEFVESLGEGGLSIGLNFVSFQRSLGALTRILHLPGWMGDANFGGAPNASTPIEGGLAPLQLVSVIAGGFYAVPPRGLPFPGADIF
jgi:deferrochelatase/peroxidase EfeB